MSTVAWAMSAMPPLAVTDTASGVSNPIDKSAGRSTRFDGTSLGASCPPSRTFAATPCCSSRIRRTSSGDFLLRSALPVFLVRGAKVHRAFFLLQRVQDPVGLGSHA
jgi:hypothetical protein